MTRRELLKRAAGACAAVLAVPMINRGRYRVFVYSPATYSARAVELMKRAAVINMLSPFTISSSLGAKWFSNPDSFTPTDLQKFRDSGINIFDQVVKLVGVEHVGVGSDTDLDGYDDMPPEENKKLRAGYKDSYGFREKIDIEGLDHPQRMFDLTEGLIRRKYNDKDIELILGGNFKRALAQT